MKRIRKGWSPLALVSVTIIDLLSEHTSQLQEEVTAVLRLELSLLEERPRFTKDVPAGH